MQNEQEGFALSKKVKVAVSACLLGQNCRYDGSNKKDESLQSVLKGCDEVIAFCPEDAILGTPRETIDIVNGRAIGNESGEDYTEWIEKYASDLCQKHPDIDMFVVKSKSPSCALSSAKHFDEEKNLIKKGEGIFTKTVQKIKPNTTIFEREGK